MGCGKEAGGYAGRSSVGQWNLDGDAQRQARIEIAVADPSFRQDACVLQPE